MCQERKLSLSFDYLIGEKDNRFGYRQAKRLCGLEIDHKLELCRLPTGKSAGLVPLNIEST